MSDMSAAEFAAHRYLTGHTIDSLAAAMGINPRTVRAWESGRDLVSDWAAGRVREELAASRALTRRMIEAGTIIAIPRHPHWGKPRGWWLTAAARALEVEPDLIIEWVYGDDPDADVYELVNQLRREAFRAAVEAGEVEGDAALLSPVGPADWRHDDTYGDSLGDPEADWCATVDDDDVVTVWAAGDAVASMEIPGLRAAIVVEAAGLEGRES